MENNKRKCIATNQSLFLTLNYSQHTFENHKMMYTLESKMLQLILASVMQLESGREKRRQKMERRMREKYVYKFGLDSKWSQMFENWHLKQLSEEIQWGKM